MHTDASTQNMGHFHWFREKFSVNILAICRVNQIRLLNTFFGYFTATNQTWRDSYYSGYKWADLYFEP